jgi:hypothetical protein
MIKARSKPLPRNNGPISIIVLRSVCGMSSSFYRFRNTIPSSPIHTLNLKNLFPAHVVEDKVYCVRIDSNDLHHNVNIEIRVICVTEQPG